MVLLLSMAIILLLAFAIEAIWHKKRLKKIPCRISVSGTRGKSSCVRYITQLLQDTGHAVLAKTTGAEAMYILPDGTVEPLNRHRPANIIEQKKLVKRATKLGVDYLVTEVMSIHPENHRVESQHLLQPHYTIITNLRPDHLLEKDQSMAKLYESDLNRGAKIIVPEQEFPTEWEPLKQKKQFDFHLAITSDGPNQPSELAKDLFNHLIAQKPELKSPFPSSESSLPRVPASPLISEQGTIYFPVFSTNDRTSSTIIINEIARLSRFKNHSRIALLATRADRGERSQQWLDWLKQKPDLPIDEYYYIGPHARVFERRLKFGEALSGRKAEKIQAALIEKINQPAIVFGLMNIHGIGTELLRHWTQQYIPFELEESS